MIDDVKIFCGLASIQNIKIRTKQGNITEQTLSICPTKPITQSNIAKKIQKEVRSLKIRIESKKSMFSLNINSKRSRSEDDLLEVYSWGCNEMGQLGVGDEKNRNQPVLLKDIKGSNEWCRVVCGRNHTALVTTGGDIYTCGTIGAADQLGYGEGHIVISNKPKPIKSLAEKIHVVEASCGPVNTAVITRAGHLYTCGVDESHTHRPTFTKVEGLDSVHVSLVSCGGMYTVVLTTEGRIYTFGINKHGRTGHGVTTGRQSEPKMVEALRSKKVIFAATGSAHTACICEDGETYTWGEGEFGRLGHGDETSRSIPTLVNDLVGKNATGIACGFFHTLVRTKCGNIYSFGQGEDGQLGHGMGATKLLTPTLVEALEGKFVKQVACGWFHSMALACDGRLFTWGHGGYGRLGHGSVVHYSTPCIVECFIGQKVVSISSCAAHSMALVDSTQSPHIKKMKAMVNDESCSDVVFLLDNDERVNASRSVLIGHSEYFQAMFRSNMKESKENKIRVQDCSKHIFLLFLQYLYTNVLDCDLENAMQLCVLADKYQEDELCKYCLKVVEEGLSNENAIELIVEAEYLGFDRLLDVCKEYFVSNCGKLLNAEGLGSLSQPLLVDLIVALNKC